VPVCATSRFAQRCGSFGTDLCAFPDPRQVARGGDHVCAVDAIEDGVRCGEHPAAGGLQDLGGVTLPNPAGDVRERIVVGTHALRGRAEVGHRLRLDLRVSSTGRGGGVVLEERRIVEQGVRELVQERFRGLEVVDVAADGDCSGLESS